MRSFIVCFCFFLFCFESHPDVNAALDLVVIRELFNRESVIRRSSWDARRGKDPWPRRRPLPPSLPPVSAFRSTRFWKVRSKPAKCEGENTP